MTNGWRKYNWTPEGDAKLIELWNSDRELAEVASMLNMGRELVVRRASHLRVHHKKPLRSRMRQAVERPDRETESVPCRCGMMVFRYKGSTRSLCDKCRQKAQAGKGGAPDGMPPGDVLRYLELASALETAPKWERDEIRWHMDQIKARSK